MSEPSAEIAGLFPLGARVAIGDGEAIGHCRTPWYVRGKIGVVVGIHGVFRDPVRLAYHRPGLPGQMLYKVRLRQHDIWPAYAGAPDDNLEVDIYEPWLAKAPPTAGKGGA
jgi:nitrile hydratase subunit beta